MSDTPLNNLRRDPSRRYAAAGARRMRVLVDLGDLVALGTMFAAALALLSVLDVLNIAVEPSDMVEPSAQAGQTAP